jgi:hypothetical protein
MNIYPNNLFLKKDRELLLGEELFANHSSSTNRKSTKKKNMR